MSIQWLQCLYEMPAPDVTCHNDIVAWNYMELQWVFVINTNLPLWNRTHSPASNNPQKIIKDLTESSNNENTWRERHESVWLVLLLMIKKAPFFFLIKNKHMSFTDILNIDQQAFAQASPVLFQLPAFRTEYNLLDFMLTVEDTLTFASLPLTILCLYLLCQLF